VVFSAEAVDSTGVIVYENRAVLFARAVWGKINYQEDFEDTQKAVDFDKYLKQNPIAS
jgi:hypothetical protein